MPLKVLGNQFGHTNFTAIFHPQHDVARNIIVNDRSPDTVMQRRSCEAIRANLLIVGRKFKRYGTLSAPWRDQKP